MAPALVEYWVTCMLDPWPALAHDDAFGEIVGALREDGEYAYDEVELSLIEGAPAFVPAGSVVLHVVGPSTANWDEVLELLDAIAAAGEGVVFADDRQIVLDRRSLRPGVKAFKEEPAWATKLRDEWRVPIDVVIFGARDIDAHHELRRVGLEALAGRVTVVSVTHDIERLAARVGIDRTGYSSVIHVYGPGVDPLVAGQVLAHAARGRAFALAPGDHQQELQR